jgi:HAD superfamily hydrolase (TIGR01509 family)
VDAVLWDMDGLMVDSEPLWTVAEVELARSLGGEWTDEVKALVVGTRLDVAVPGILGYFGVEPTDARVADTSDWLLHRMVELFAGELPLLPGVGELLKALDAEGVPMALVSSSYRVLVDAVLAHGVGPFGLTLSGDEVRHGKPHPEPYLTAAAALGLAPGECVAIEDSNTGATSAETAGCPVLVVENHVPVAPGPRRTFAGSLTEVTVESLAELA